MTTTVRTNHIHIKLYRLIPRSSSSSPRNIFCNAGEPRPRLPARASPARLYINNQSSHHNNTSPRTTTPTAHITLYTSISHTPVKARMAPRSNGNTYRDVHGERDRRVLGANTGAGVNQRRSTAAGGRAGLHARDGQRTQAGVPGRATMPRPQNGRAAPRPQVPSNHGSQNVSRGPQVLAACMTPDVVTNEPSTESPTRRSITLASRPKANSSPVRPPVSFTGSRLTRVLPGAQRHLNPMSPVGRESSFTMSTTPIRMINRPREARLDHDTLKSPVRAKSRSVSAQGSPTKRPLYRGKDPVKKAFTNKNLLRLFSDKKPLSPPKKSSLERPVFKMGISEEYSF